MPRPWKRVPFVFLPQSRTFGRSKTIIVCDPRAQGIDSGSEKGNKGTNCFVLDFQFALDGVRGQRSWRRKHFFSRPHALEKGRIHFSSTSSLRFHALTLSPLSLSLELSLSKNSPSLLFLLQPFFPLGTLVQRIIFANLL